MDLGEGHGWPMVMPNVISERDRCTYGSLRIVFVQNRNTEDRHEPVAHHLRHGPAELLNHALKVRHRRTKEV